MANIARFLEDVTEQPDNFTRQDSLTEDADMCIVCKDGRLYGHRMILSKWSSVIAACPGATNATDNSILEFSVEETTKEWREVLGIIYPTPITVIDWENVGRIFVIADKYSMDGIGQRCLAFLMHPNTTFSTTRLRKDYVLKWLAFAAQYRQKLLAERCMQYIRLNYRSIEELRSSPEKCYLRDVLATTPEGVHYIIEILQFVMQQRR